MGDKIPLPDVNGEVLCGIHPVQAALHAGKRQPYTAFFMVIILYMFDLKPKLV
jgi:hypothetical protein